MKKSFDDIFKEKLSGFEKTPPNDLKAAILASNPIQGTGYSYIYILSVLSLLLFSFYPAGQEQKSGSIEPDKIYTLKKQSIYTSNTQTDLHSNLKQTHVDSVNNLNATTSYRQISPEPSNSALNTGAKTTGVSKKSYSNISQMSKTTNELKPTYEERISSKYYLNDLKSLDLDQYEFEPNLLSDLSLIGLEDEKFVVPKSNKKQSSFSPYLNIGTFLNYNKVTPQLEDEIYIDKYESPVSFSPSRLGLSIETGIHKQWAKKLASRFGVSFNNFNQGYSFSVRPTKPDYVELNASGNFFEPVFNEERIEVNKRVSMLGLKGQVLWQIFPNINDVVFTSFEFQHIMGKVPQFDYDEVNYKLMQSSQYLIELGFRKIIMQRKVGALYLMPSLRYSLNKSSNNEILSVKPFSAGLTLSYGFK